MKKEFSKAWKASKQPRKQRKYLANAPLHIKNQLLSSHLSKELRDKHKTRNVTLRKGDTVKIMRGKFAGKSGKVSDVKTKYSKIYVDGIMTQKLDGSKVKVALRPSNLLITALDLEDKKRAVRLGTQVSTKKEAKVQKVDAKKEEKEKTKEVKKADSKLDKQEAPKGVSTGAKNE